MGNIFGREKKINDDERNGKESEEITMEEEVEEDVNEVEGQWSSLLSGDESDKEVTDCRPAKIRKLHPPEKETTAPGDKPSEDIPNFEISVLFNGRQYRANFDVSKEKSEVIKEETLVQSVQEENIQNVKVKDAEDQKQTPSIGNTEESRILDNQNNCIICHKHTHLVKTLNKNKKNQKENIKSSATNKLEQSLNIEKRLSRIEDTLRKQKCKRKIQKHPDQSEIKEFKNSETRTQTSIDGLLKARRKMREHNKAMKKRRSLDECSKTQCQNSIHRDKTPSRNSNILQTVEENLWKKVKEMKKADSLRHKETVTDIVQKESDQKVQNKSINLPDQPSARSLEEIYECTTKPKEQTFSKRNEPICIEKESDTKGNKCSLDSHSSRRLQKLLKGKRKISIEKDPLELEKSSQYKRVHSKRDNTQKNASKQASLEEKEDKKLEEFFKEAIGESYDSVESSKLVVATSENDGSSSSSTSSSTSDDNDSDTSCEDSSTRKPPTPLPSHQNVNYEDNSHGVKVTEAQSENCKEFINFDEIRQVLHAEESD